MKKILIAFLVLVSQYSYSQVGVAAADTSLRATVNGSIQIWKSKAYYASLFATIYNKNQSDARYAPIVGGGYVPTSRTISVNGVTQDLTANRTFTVTDITGNSGTATALQTARMINGVSFNGTANITVADATKEPIISGTGFVKKSGTTTTFDNSTYYLASNPNAYVNDSQVSANTNVAANTAARHSAVTIGTANGLSLSTQTLSLGLSSSSTVGALSAADWSTFNGKQNALGYTPYNATNPAGYTSNTGTVTTVTSTNSTGVTFSISNPTSTPNITLALTSAAVSLGNVENKSSATIRGELTGTNVITALGYTPANDALAAHLAGTEFFSGYKRFQADAGIDRALYMGSAANDNPSIGDIIQMSNTNDASTTTAGYALQLGTGSDFLFNSFNGAPGSISFIPRFRMTNGGLLNYSNDMGTSYGDRTVTDFGNVKKYVHSETGYTVTLTGSGNGSSTTITIPHGLTGIDTDSFVLLTANSNPASNFKYATVDATNVYIYYAVAPTSGSQNLYYSALIKYIQR